LQSSGTQAVDGLLFGFNGAFGGNGDVVFGQKVGKGSGVAFEHGGSPGFLCLVNLMAEFVPLGTGNRGHSAVSTWSGNSGEQEQSSGDQRSSQGKVGCHTFTAS